MRMGIGLEELCFFRYNRLQKKHTDEEIYE